MTTRLRVGHVTTCRSDYGPAYWLIHELVARAELDVRLIVGGSHLSPHHGHTVDEIERDGRTIAARVPFLAGEREVTPQALGAAVIGFGEVFDRERLDLVIVYGDRLELLAVAAAATARGIPIAHVCGGDVTEGALDDQVRHAVTKLSHVHFPSTASATARIAQMGEEDWRIHHTGDPALDHFRRGDAADPTELAATLGFAPDRDTLAVTLHPATRDGDPAADVAALVSALEAYRGSIVITSPAPDPGAEIIREAMIALAARRPATTFVESLGSRRYRGLLAVAGAVVGNSSSGLIEASLAGIPAINIGHRQAGRDRGANVIDVEPTSVAITAALATALAPAFRASLTSLASPYGTGDAARAIVDAIVTLPPRARLLAKSFVTR